MQRLGDKAGASGSLGSGRLSRLACVYTTLIGGYEKLNEQEVASNSRLPFICLTDDPELRSETWQIRRVEPLFGLDPIRSQRALKVLPHEHLPDFDCSIYIDNSIDLKVPPDALLEQYLGASPFCLPEHSFRDSVLEEFLEVEALGYDDQGRLFEQLNHYALELPEVLEERPFWTAVLLRDHRNPKVRRMLGIWYAHVQRYSRRDQLSVNFAFKRAGLTPEVLRIGNYESWFHSWPKGSDARPANFKRLATAFLSHPAARARELAKDNAAKSGLLTRLERDLAKERLEKKESSARVAELETALADARLKRQESDARVAELEAALADQRNRRAALKSSKAKLMQALASERRHREAVEAQNQALLSSTSWRITAPLRNVVQTVRKIRRSLVGQRRAIDRATTKARPVVQGEQAQEADSPTSSDPMATAFFRDGFIGPIDLFTKPQCELILNHYRRGVPPATQLEWPKDLAVRDRFFYQVAKRPALIALLRLLLGEDIVLWGASVVERAPGQTHIWHTDIETSAPDGRFVTVWVGLENTCRDSALQLISRSHRFGRPIQQEVYERGLRRGEASDEMVTAWAQEHDALSDFVQPT